MLRPSRRQGHERISQHEGSRTADSAVDTDGQNARDADEQDTQEPQNGESIDVDEENDLVLQANDNSEEVQENANQISNNAAIGSERDLQLRRQSMVSALPSIIRPYCICDITSLCTDTHGRKLSVHDADVILSSEAVDRGYHREGRG